jgi:hypothetical protein
MFTIKFITLFLGVTLLTACVPSEQVIQTAIAKTQAAIPTMTPSIMPSTTSTNPQSFAAILGSNGFVFTTNYCESPCTSYEHMNPWITAKVFGDGGFEIFGSKFDTQYIYPIITQLYNQDVTSWIADTLPVLLNDPNALYAVDEKFCQSGNVNNLNIEVCMMDYGNRIWITITPKGSFFRLQIITI